MKLIGITGPIASGKSTVTALLKEKGALVIDADTIAREVVEPGMPAWKDIVGYFGDDILLPNQAIDRRKLGDIVFRDPKKLHFLNSAVHPHVITEINKRVRDIENRFGNGKIVVIDVPLLIEVGMHKSCDLTIVVTADKDVRLHRLLNQGLFKEEAENRIAAQSGKDELQEQADIVIHNDSTLDTLKARVNELWERIRAN